jgi:hypothetical protein
MLSRVLLCAINLAGSLALDSGIESDVPCSVMYFPSPVPAHPPFATHRSAIEGGGGGESYPSPTQEKVLLVLLAIWSHTLHTQRKHLDSALDSDARIALWVSIAPRTQSELRLSDEHPHLSVS